MKGNIAMDPWVIFGLACITIAHLIWMYIMFKPTTREWDERAMWWGVYLFIAGCIIPVFFSDAL